MRTRDYLSDIFLLTDNAGKEREAINQLFNKSIDQGYSVDEAQAILNKKFPQTKADKLAGKLGGYLDDAAKQTHQGIFNAADKVPVGKGGFTATRLAGNNPVMKTVSKALPLLGAGMAVLDAGDIVFGQDSAANKVMDGTAMAIGGTIGGVLGMGNPLLAAAGASTGKAVSDGLQWLFGDKQTAEQRRMEETLAALQGRYI